jgi:hypothetical protein
VLHDIAVKQVHVAAHPSSPDTCARECFNRTNEPSFSISGEIGVKAIHIELPAGRSASHLITASFHFGPLEKVKREAENIVHELERRQFSVTRLKLEALIGNFAVPGTDQAALEKPQSNYFEFHVKVPARSSDLLLLESIAKSNNAHLSRTSSHRFNDGTEFRFITLRVYRAGRSTGMGSLFGNNNDHLSAHVG